jgi:hypothetical protein
MDEKSIINALWIMHLVDFALGLLAWGEPSNEFK